MTDDDDDDDDDDDMLSITNKMQHNTIFFIAVKALHVSGGFPA